MLKQTQLSNMVRVPALYPNQSKKSRTRSFAFIKLRFNFHKIWFCLTTPSLTVRETAKKKAAALTSQSNRKINDKISTVSIATLGCKVNQCESAGIAEELAARGLAVVPFHEHADVCIINTCTVTGKTDFQSRQLVSRAFKKNPQSKIIVTGCYAQRAPQEVASLPGVSHVMGNTEKENIADVVFQTVENPQKIIVGNIRGEKKISPLGASSFPDHTRAFLKIQDGCNSFCSYCIIPYTRGASRSLPLHEVLSRMTALAANGYREIVLTGINLGMWGRDLVPETSLAELVGEISRKRVVERIRLSSLEPNEITDKMISLIKNSEVVCPHLHLSLQSGNDRILGLMRRDYQTAFFRELVWKICDSIPGIAIGIDVIAGFPGETEAEFSGTLSLIEELPLAYLHVFPFSSRPGTPAAKMEGRLPENEKKRRARLLREMGMKKRHAFAVKFIGKPLHVLIEGRKDKKTGLPTGFSENYIPVVVKNNDVKVNAIATVIPDCADEERLRADTVQT